jgi:hypothetical protein
MPDHRRNGIGGCCSLIGGMLLALVLYYGWQSWQSPHGSIPWLPSSSSWQVTGSPTVSASLVCQVLEAYHSPAQSECGSLYDDGVAYQIDPVYALAFFLHESSFGTVGTASNTRSLGNIICTPGYACIKGFRAYASWSDGFLDWYKLLTDEYIPRGLKTIDQIIPVYAPPSENNDSAYICGVKHAVSTWRAGQVMVTGSGC